MPRFLLAGLATLLLLAGCDQLGIETPDKTLARQEAEGRAIGSACRHAGRALEDCYARAQQDKKNRYISRASIFNGWKDMDAYMRENNLAIVPVTPVELAPLPAAVTEGDNADAEAAKNVENDTREVKPGAKPEADKEEAKPGSKPETKVEAPANPKTNGKISAGIDQPHYG